MSRPMRCCLAGGGLVFLIISAHLLCTPVHAAGDSPDWRPTYDLIMRWVNFIILAGLMIKFARKPIINFIRVRKRELALEIDRMENKKTLAQEKIKEIEASLADKQRRLARIKERIVRQGERKKQQLIETAETESRLLVEGARRKVDNLVLEARAGFRSEMVEAAFDLAIDRLPAEITDQDHAKIVQQFLVQADAEDNILS